MKKILQTIAFALCICLTSYAQNAPSNFINYQGVASNASGEVISETAIALQIALKFGSETATASYIETHNPTTDANGVFSIQIGNGTLVSGAYDVSNFGVESSYITVSLNGVEIGTTELNAVPYALSSGDSQWSINGANIENKNTGTVKVLTDLEVTGDIMTSNGTSISEFSTDGTLADDSDTALPTEKAVKTYVDNATSGSVSSINDLIDGKTDLSSVYLGDGSGSDINQNNTNVGIGIGVLPQNSTGQYNVGIGFYSLFGNSSGSYNSAYGHYTLYHNTTGNNNTAIGDNALSNNVTGSNNTAIGINSLRNNTIGVNNTAIGSLSLRVNTTGENNTANGFRSLIRNTTGLNNTASGAESLFKNITGENNTANGFQALYSNTTGSFNIAMGTSALENNISGSDNLAMGFETLKANTSGEVNIAVGEKSLLRNTTGEFNLALGFAALSGNITGSRNVALGYKAGYNETGSNKLYISNRDTAYPLIYGEFDTKILKINGATTVKSNVDANPDLILEGKSNTTAGDDGIISSDPKYAGSDIFIRSNDAVVIELDYDNDETGQFEIKAGDGSEIFEVAESGNATLAGSLTQNSDRRLKKDIEKLPYGLKEILQLQPKAYNWINREEEHKSLGLIAQEVQVVLKEIVSAQDDEQKTLGVSYTELIPVLINAIKEQQTQIETLKTTNTTKDVALAEILKRVKTLEYTAELNKTKGNSLSSAN